MAPELQKRFMKLAADYLIDHPELLTPHQLKAVQDFNNRALFHINTTDKAA